jgi:hypothetical protein
MSDFNNVDPRVLEYYNKLREMGYDLPVTSTYRSPLLNKQVGGARGSQHMRGFAIDVAPPNMSPEGANKLIADASRVGFTGIGVYRPGKLHFDIGPRRYWGPDYHAGSAPDWAKPVLAEHMRGDFNSSGPLVADSAPFQPPKPPQPRMAGGPPLPPPKPIGPGMGQPAPPQGIMAGLSAPPPPAPQGPPPQMAQAQPPMMQGGPMAGSPGPMARPSPPPQMMAQNDAPKMPPFRGPAMQAPPAPPPPPVQTAMANPPIPQPKPFLTPSVKGTIGKVGGLLSALGGMGGGDNGAAQAAAMANEDAARKRAEFAAQALPYGAGGFFL